MRVVILTPTAFPDVTGNAVTAERWRRSLVSMGHAVKVLPVGKTPVSTLSEEIDRFRPDLIHGHHAFRSGRFLQSPEVRDRFGNIPTVISPAGTDINGDLEDPVKRRVVFGVCRMAGAIVAQGQGTLERLGQLMPGLGDKTVHVPKSFLWMGDLSFDLRAASGWASDDFLFFMPAGIRPVKGNLECLEAIERLHALRPKTRAVFSGPDLDADYARRFETEIQRLRAFARRIPTIPPEAMRSAYAGADVVLNASRAEGLSNVLIEAVVCGKPVLATAIQGNRRVVLGDNGGPCGCLFEPGNSDDFVKQALRIMDDPSFQEELARSGLTRSTRWPDTRTEAEGLLSAYRKAMAVS